MDCLCCANGGAGPATNNEEFLGSVCHLQAADGTPAKFPAQADRYVLYVIAGCPFAARPWAVASIYGLPIQVVKLFPASAEDGWFFEATSDEEKQLVANFATAVSDGDPLHGAHHLKQLYQKANPEFTGAISVPLLWDKVQDTAVSNSSLGLAQMISLQMREMATRHKDLELFPVEKKEEHTKLLLWIHANITTAVYRMNATRDGKIHDEMVIKYYQSLSEMQTQIEQNGTKWLLPGVGHPTFCDIVLWISLLRLDLAYQWRFGLGKANIREDYPRLQQYVNDLQVALPELKETVLPRDIMALYFMTHKWTANSNGRTLPMVPAAWSKINGY